MYDGYNIRQINGLCHVDLSPRYTLLLKSVLSDLQMEKTPVTMLQELMVKLGGSPEYECMSQSGPHHMSTFEYRCAARGVEARATARSKKEAKQEAARNLLYLLAKRGHEVPPPYNIPVQSGNEPGETTGTAEGFGAGVGPRSFVALIKELSEEYHLPAPAYELVSDTGPAHMRQFVVRASLGQHSRMATSTTKKAARQLAAQQLYLYLREHLSRVTADFVESTALVRAHERAMDRYVAALDEAPAAAWRPDLGQRVADYHLGIVAHTEEAKCKAALELVESWYSSGSDPEAAEAVAEAAAVALGMSSSWGQLKPLLVLELAPASPALAFVGLTRAQASANALRYLKLTLRFPKPESTAKDSAKDTPAAF